jgi:hypothetical protein
MSVFRHIHNINKPSHDVVDGRIGKVLRNLPNKDNFVQHFQKR